MTDMAASSPKHVFVIYMQSTPDDVWRALTDPSMTKKYFHDTRVVSDFQVGSPIAYLLDEEAGPREAVRGTILESDPPRLLKTSFYFAENSHGGKERSEETVVTYAVEPVGEVVKLTVTHEGFAGESEMFRSTATGWPPILSGLKTLLETGRPLNIPGMGG